MIGRFDREISEIRARYEKVMADGFCVERLGLNGCERYRTLVEEVEEVLRVLGRKLDFMEQAKFLTVSEENGFCDLCCDLKPLCGYGFVDSIGPCPLDIEPCQGEDFPHQKPSFENFIPMGGA